jgi:predicted HAD superfamily phosphohydrolase YqeG
MQDSNSFQQFYIYVDIDDTLVRSYGSKRIPISATIEHIKQLKHQGATLYCWSSGGAEYAKNTATELGISDIFEAFLPKPQMLLDDQEIQDWRALIQVHPLSCQSKNLEDYRHQLQARLTNDFTK